MVQLHRPIPAVLHLDLHID